MFYWCITQAFSRLAISEIMTILIMFHVAFAQTGKTQMFFNLNSAVETVARKVGWLQQQQTRERKCISSTRMLLLATPSYCTKNLFAWLLAAMKIQSLIVWQKLLSTTNSKPRVLGLCDLV